MKGLKLILGIFLLLLLGLAGTGGWLLTSASGTAWLIERATSWSDGGIQVASSQGSLLGSLQLEGVRLAIPGLQVDLARVQVETRLEGISPVKVVIPRMHFQGVQLISSPAEERSRTAVKTDFSWPQAPAWAAAISIELQDLQLSDLRWMRQGEAPLGFEQLSARLSWGDGALGIRDLQLRTPDLTLKGQLSAGLRQPELKTELLVVAERTDADWSQVQLRADLQRGDGDQLARGSLQASVATNYGSLHAETGQLILAADRLEFAELLLSRGKTPGQVVASGRLDFADGSLDSRLLFKQLDLRRETGQPVTLSGTLEFLGTLESYQGRFELHNLAEIPYGIDLTGDFGGNLQTLQLQNLQGNWIAGTLSGSADLTWTQGWQVQASLSAQKLDPQKLIPDLPGQVNLDLHTDLRALEQGIAGRVKVELHDSTLVDQLLSGSAILQFTDQSLKIEDLQLLGEGITLQAQGNPVERLQLSLAIERLQQLYPPLQGRLKGEGWLRWKAGQGSGQLQLQSRQLGYADWTLARGTLGVRLEEGLRARLQLKGEGLRNPAAGLNQASVKLSGEGRIEEHQLNLELNDRGNQLQTALNGGWTGSEWQGQLRRLLLKIEQAGSWQLTRPANLRLGTEQLTIAPLHLNSSAGGTLELQGEYSPSGRQGSGSLSWQEVDLGLFNPWLKKWNLTGRSGGLLEVRLTDQPQVSAAVQLNGELHRDGLSFTLTRGDWNLSWRDGALRSDLQLALADGSSLVGDVSGQLQDLDQLPEQMQLQLAGKEIPLTLLHPWLPPGLNLSGKLDLNSQGRWRRGKPLDLQGSLQSRDGKIFWQEEEGLLSSDIKTFSLSWSWRERLSGALELDLGDSGGIDGRFELPLPAQFPLRPDLSGDLGGDLTARLQNLELVSLLFPGRIQESRGELKLDLNLAGTWGEPDLQGALNLIDGGAFVVPLGLPLSGITLQGNFVDQRLNVSQLQLRSGEGTLNGSGEMILKNWRPDRFQLNLKGEKLQVVNLPEVQVQANPDLQLSGNLDRLQIRGEVQIPEAWISGLNRQNRMSNSADLVIIDQQQAAPPQRQWRQDLDLQLILGDKVLLNTAGIDARLGGQLRLQSTPGQELGATGQIQVEKGRFSSYGVKLEITRGYLHYTGGPLERPTLDILALRTSGEVKAGVEVTGTPQNPRIQLYSEPSLPDTEILSYIVLGRPVGADSSQSGLLMTAAGALLSQGESISLQEKLKNQLGLDVLDISAGNGDTESSVITTGKYLSSDLYIGLGYSIFSRTNEMKIRYSLTEDMDLESTIGTESGVDLYYNFEVE